MLGDTGTIYCSFPKPITLTKFSEMPFLGTFLLQTQYRVIAYGTVKEAISNQSFGDISDTWPKFHKFLDPKCLDIILALMVISKKKSQFNMPWDILKVLTERVIWKWASANKMIKS